MRTRLGLLVAFLLVFSVVIVKADTIPLGDPDVDVGGGGLSRHIPDTSFKFNVGHANCSGINGPGYFCFDAVNESDTRWLTLTITIPEGLGATTCQGLAEGGEFEGGIFNNCSVSGNVIVFSGGTGIGNDQHFFIAVLGIPQGEEVTVVATHNPEPGTMVLFLSGVGALLAGRRLRRKS